MRRLILALAAAGPSLWLLAPGWFEPESVVGLPSAGIYPWLAQIWRVAASAAPAIGFPAGTVVPDPDFATTLLGWAARIVGIEHAVEGWLLLHAAATAVALTWFARTKVGPGWPAACVAGVASSSPAVLAGVAGGEPEVLASWSLVAIATGPIGAVAAAVCAPSLVPAGVLVAVHEAWTTRRWWPILGAATAMAIAAPGFGGASFHPVTGVWFAPVVPGGVGRVAEVYVGFGAVALLAVAALHASTRGWSVVGAAAIAAAAFQLPVPPERILIAVPFAAMIGGLGVLRERFGAWQHGGAVLVGAALLAEGWRGEGLALPLARSSLAIPGPVASAPSGPVLDLPVSAGRRALWFQTAHGQPVAVDGAGNIAPDIVGRVSDLAECPDLAALGFVSLVVRREAEMRTLPGVVECYGAPEADDGRVARWRL